MNSMKILHVASFFGNIGDNASHIGLYRILDTILPGHNVDQLEIRRFYRNYGGADNLSFDSRFISKANEYDLLIIGGGGFLDYWVPGSQTGTTIDFPPQLIKSLRVPMLLTSIGCNPHRDVPEGNVEKLRNFLDSLLERESIRIAIRNDGSAFSIKNQIGKHYLVNILEILDNGYFFESENKQSLLPSNDDYIAINITADQIAMNSSMSSKIEASTYYDNLASAFTTAILEYNIKLVFIPHIYGDLNAISNVLSNMEDYLVRRYVTVAPCIQGDHGARQLFSLYNNSSMVIGMRYHANVCSLAMGRRPIGLAALDRIRYTYDYFDLTERCCPVHGQFGDYLLELIRLDLSDVSINNTEVQQLVHNKRIDSLNAYKKMLGDLGVL